jgi:hypothetical protein
MAVKIGEKARGGRKTDDPIVPHPLFCRTKIGDDTVHSFSSKSSGWWSMVSANEVVQEESDGQEWRQPEGGGGIVL